MNIRALAPVLALSASCSRAEPVPVPPAATAEAHACAEPATPPAVTVASSAAAMPGAGPAVIAPSIPTLEKGMVDHVLPAAGWTRDGTALGYRVAIAVNLICDLLRPSGAREHFEADNEDAAQAKKFGRRADALGFLGAGPGRWAYAGELELTWAAREGDCDKQPPVAGVVEVGARVPGEPPSYPIKLVMQSKSGVCFRAAHPDLIAISPEGKHLGAIAHGFAGEWANDWPMGIATVAAVAEGAYNNAGLAHHKRGDYARAADLFQKAARADPSSKIAAFNLACALARLGDARTEAALVDAIARGGDEVKKKAQKDADFDGVRANPWFTALVR